jgi:hypothetical protein
MYRACFLLLLLLLLLPLHDVPTVFQPFAPFATHCCCWGLMALQVRLNAKQEKKYRARLAPGAATSGLSSTLAFTPVQVRPTPVEAAHLEIVCKTCAVPADAPRGPYNNILLLLLPKLPFWGFATTANMLVCW